MERLLVIPSFLAVIICLAVWFITTDAYGHEAISGWTYPISCCSTTDCSEVKWTSVVEDARGYLIVSTGELIQNGDSRIRISPDGQYHWCANPGVKDPRTICLFVPPRSF